MTFLPVLAQAAPGGGGPFEFLISIAPILMILPIWYFLMIRPQQRKIADHKAMINNVKRGDTVVTTGGIIGKVIRVVDDNELQIEIAENVRIRLVRNMIADVRTKGETTTKDAA